MTILIIALILTTLFVLYFRGCFIEKRYLEQIIYIEAYLATYHYEIHDYQENEESFWYVVDCFEELAERNLDKARTKYAWSKFTVKFSHHWQALLITKDETKFERFKNLQNKVA